MLLVAFRVKIIIMFIACSTSSCSFSFGFGTQVNIDNLDRLERGVSTKDHIRSVLGEPRGEGAGYLSAGQRSIMFYNSGRVEKGQSRVKYLLIFLADQVYDGYLWFETDTRLEQTP